jgi:hypothetical protein
MTYNLQYGFGPSLGGPASGFGITDRQDFQRISDQIRWRDPYPFSEDYCLVSRLNALYVMDGRGNYERIYQDHTPTRPTRTNVIDGREVTGFSPWSKVVITDPRPIMARKPEQVMPGETMGCVGCHERRTLAGTSTVDLERMAFKRPASPLKPIDVVPMTPVSYVRDVQPMLDRHCVKCHNAEKLDGGISLEGHHGPMVSHSYAELSWLNQMEAADTYGNDRPYTKFSAIARLIDKLSGKHYEVHAAERELAAVRI